MDDIDDVNGDIQEPDMPPSNGSDDVNKPQAIAGEAGAKVLRDPVTGKFLPGTARGPGRPHGSKGKLNKTVVETLSAIWEKRGMEVLEELADTNPAALAAIVSRLVPADMVREAIDGDEAKKQDNTDITIRLVTKVEDNHALTNDTPRLVEGELMDDDAPTVTH